MSEPKLICLCCTFLRPQLLSDMVRMFEQFQYNGSKRLIILDDAGQYPNGMTGPDWELISYDQRFPTLGEKRNALFEIAMKHKPDGLVVMDDDDGYCSWTLQAHATAIAKAGVSLPSHVFTDLKGNGTIRVERVRNTFHASWGYTPDAFEAAEGYTHKDVAEDTDLMKAFRRTGCTFADPTEEFPPYFIHRWKNTGSFHISAIKENQKAILFDTAVKCEKLTTLPDPAGKNWSLLAREFMGCTNDVSGFWKEHKSKILERVEK